MLYLVPALFPWEAAMPLKKGKSDETKSSNIKELLHAYHEKGKIGNIKPKNAAHARKIAAAIAYKKARGD
jgi:hypothetical protein